MADRTYLRTHDDPVGCNTTEVACLCTGGQDNTLRRTGIIYPVGRHLSFKVLGVLEF